MATITIAGKEINVTDEGYLTDPSQWTKEIAVEIAIEEDISLTEKHFALIDFLRDQFQKGIPLTIRKVGTSGIVDIKGFYELFPGGPLKKSLRIAGIPKPVSCV